MKGYAKSLVAGWIPGIFLLFISFFQNLNAQTTPLSGAYTIGGPTPDFTSFSAAAAALTARGVSGPVVFEAAPGVYAEKLTLGAVSGASSVNTVLFRKKTGTPGEVWLGNDTGAIALSETDFVKFEGMNLGKSISTGYAVNLNNQCTGISFLACQFDLAGNSAGIYGYGNFDSLYIGHCGFKGGGYGVHLQGNLTSYNIIMEENLFAGQEIRGIYLHDYYFSSPLIQGNEVISTFPEPNFIAIDVSSTSYTKILRNRIRQSAGIGISCNSFGSSTDPTVIANNMVYVSGYSGSTGIALQSDAYMKVFHNSVHCSGQENSAALVFNSGDGNAACNNILAHSNGGMAVHLFGYVSGIEMDFNNLYTNGSTIGALGYQYYAANLPDWQSLTQLDSHSLSVLPDFYSESNLHIQNPLLDGKGVPLAIVPVDFDGELRDTLAPDMGADEFTPQPLDAAISGILSPGFPLPAGNQPIRLQLKNYGLMPLISAQLSWQINLEPVQTFSWTGNLPAAGRTEVAVGNYTFLSDSVYTIRSWSALPNSGADGMPANDTFSTGSLRTALCGQYTIGGANPDFATFADAVQRLHTWGVGCPVVFSVRPGDYNEHLSVNQIPGADSIHTIRFQGESNDPTAARLSIPFDNNRWFVLNLENTGYLAFERLTIRGIQPLYYTDATVYVSDQTYDIRFENCRLELADSTGNPATEGRVVYTTGARLITLTGCTVTGGYTGLYAVDGNDESRELSVLNSDFLNQYSLGIHCANLDSVLLLDNRFRTHSNYYYTGIRAEYMENGLQIRRNKITGAPGYGLYLYSLTGTPDKPAVIANNFISNKDAGTSPAVLIGGCKDIGFFFNSMQTEASSSWTPALQVDYLNGPLTLQNNIFSNLGIGTAINFSGDAQYLFSDHNNFYTKGNKLATWNSQYVDNLAAWQSTSGNDPHSLSVSPKFTSLEDFHVYEPDLDSAGTPVAGILDDIDGDLRDPMRPDIGADEFVRPPNDAGVVALPGPHVPFKPGLQPLIVAVRNFGAAPLQSLDIRFSVKSQPQPVYQWTGNLAPKDTMHLTVGSYDFTERGFYACVFFPENPNGQPDENAFNDTLKIEISPSLCGSYTIGGTLPDFPGLTEAIDTLNTYGVACPVTFEFRNGVYDFPNTPIYEFAGQGPENPVTFRSESGAAANVNIRISGYAFSLVRTRNLIFENLSFENMSSGYSNIYVFSLNYCRNLTWKNCNITTKSSTSAGGINISGNAYPERDSLLFEGCTFKGGKNGIFTYGGADFFIKNNIFKDIAGYAVDLGGTHHLLTGNRVDASLSTSAGFHLSGEGHQVLKNDITVRSGAGIYALGPTSLPAEKIVIANNFVKATGTAQLNCIRVTGSAGVYFNSCLVSGTNAVSASLKVESGLIDIRNNVLANSGGGYAVTMFVTTNITADYNALYTTGPRLAYNNTTATPYNDLASWQSATSLDAHSVSIDPLFTSATDLHTQQAAFNGAGNPVAGITDDYDSQPRDLQFPDIGADEFTPGGSDLELGAILSPVSGCSAGPAETVSIAIINRGGGTQTGFNVFYQLNNQPVVSENVGAFSVAPGATKPYTFAKPVNLAAQGNFTLKTWVQPAADDDPGNDTLIVTITIGEFNLDIAVAEDSICKGKSVVLDANVLGSATYLWNTGHTTRFLTVQPATDMTYTVTVTKNGCQHVDSMHIVVLPVPPQVNITPNGPTSFCPGGSVTLQAGPAGDIRWNTGEITPAIEVTLSGVYSVTLTNNVGCSTTDQISVNVWSTTATGDKEICSGEQAVLHLAFPLLSGQWSTGDTAQNITVNPLQTTAYYVKGMDIHNCPVSDTVIITVNTDAITAPATSLFPPDQSLNVIPQSAAFSWLPPSHALWSEVFIWPAGAARPVLPFISKTTAIHATANLEHGRTYLWQIRSFNTCTEWWSDTLTFTTSGLPDLQITQLTAPPSGLYGQKIVVQWTVKNTGQNGTGAKGWRDMIVFSPDGVPAHKIILGTFNNIGYLNPGESYTQTKNIDLPADKVGYGYYDLTVMTDYYTDIPELNESNNDAATQILIEIPPLPDLQVVSVGAPTAAFSGNTITVNWSVRNAGNLKALRNWVDAVFISSDSIFNPDQAVSLKKVYHSGPSLLNLLPDSSYNHSTAVSIPLGYSGVYWIHVVTDYNKNSIELLENNNTGTVTVPLVVTIMPPPDLEPYSISFPPAAISGQAVAVSFNVRNNGATNYPAQDSWYDELFLSPSAVFDNKAISVGKQYHSGGIAPGGSYQVSRTVNLPSGISGQYYWYVKTDAGNNLFEFTFENNNLVAGASPMQVTLPPSPDFTVSGVKPDSFTARESGPFSVQWTTHNAGNSPNKGIYRERLYISQFSAWAFATDAVPLTTYTFNYVLNPGDSVVRRSNMILPNQKTGQWYFYVVTDVNNDEKEFGFEDNNVARSAAVSIQPVFADLEIIQFSAPDSANSGNHVSTSWKTINSGDVITAGGAWADQLLLSKDTIPDGDDWVLKVVNHTGRLDTNETYMVSTTALLPNGLSGNYFLLLDVARGKEAYTDDVNPANDFAVRPIAINLQPTPDLQITGLSAPAKAYASEKIYLHYTVTNNGPGIVAGKAVSERAVLSNGPAIYPPVIDLGYRSATRILSGGESYSDSIPVTIPVYAEGNYYLVLQTDSKENVYEFQGENNNLTWVLIQVMPFNDVKGNLALLEVKTPDTALLGEPLSIHYVLKNTGDSLVYGALRDASYLSADPFFDDVADRLQTISNYTVNLAPGDSVEQTLNAPALTAKAGDYFGLARSNIAATVRESSLGDNLGIAEKSLHLDARPLLLDVPDTTILYQGGYRYYKIGVDAGKDLLITLRNTAASGLNRGRLFVGFERVPDGADFDVADDNGADIKLALIPHTQAGHYYVLAQLGSSGDPMPAAEILARALPFSLLSVSPNVVGRGLVTTTLRGAGFRPTTVVQIRKNGVVHAAAKITDLKTSMEMDVQWQLGAVPEGVYDVVAINGNEEAMLAAALTVETAQELHISVVENLANQVRVGHTVSWPIAFVNTGNLDVPLADAILLFPSFLKVTDVTSTPEKIIRLTQLIDTAVYYSDDMLSAGEASMMPLILKNVKPGEKLYLSFKVSGFHYGNLPLNIRVFPYTVEKYIKKQALVAEEQRQVVA